MRRNYVFIALRGFILSVVIFGCIFLDECDGLSNNNNNFDAITHRASAVFALMESMKKKNAFAVRILEQDPAYLNLDRRDRAFARLLLSTAERRSGQIETVIQSFKRKDGGKKNSKKPRLSNLLADAALRIGATQILFLDTPVYAAVSETVESLRMHPKIKVSEAQISFVNAVLRNIDREGRPKLEATSIIDNVDPWLTKQLLQQYGNDMTHTVVEAAMSQSPIFITVNHSITQRPKEGEEPQTTASPEDQLIEKLEQIRDVFTTTNDEGDPQPAELLPIGSIRIPQDFGGAVSKWPLYSEGAWWVQDVSATLPAIALFNTLSSENRENKLKDMYVVDLCSAPGGKTAQLCSMGFGRVDSVEFSARRSRSLDQNLKRLKMEDNCNVVIEDGTEFVPDTTNGPVQGVLVDAPCSATGVASRRPDVLRKSIDLKELSSIQRELCVHAVDNILEVGGVLVYATCSLLKQEGEDQIEWLLSENQSDTSSTSLETVPFTPGEIPGFEDSITENGWLRVIPGVLPGSLKFCDGFFVARLRKIAK